MGRWILEINQEYSTKNLEFLHTSTDSRARFHIKQEMQGWTVSFFFLWFNMELHHSYWSSLLSAWH